MPSTALFSTNQQQKAFVVAQLHQHYPTFHDGGWYYRQLLTQHIAQHSTVVDAGCGDGGMISTIADRPQQLIGIDQDRELLDRNPIVRTKIVADLQSTPLLSDSVDTITAEFVFEHLAYPAAVLKEFRRILKPGGAVIFLTPNIMHPIMLLSKIAPYQLHRWFRQTVLRKQERTHRTHYRLNTVNWLQYYGQQSGLRLETLHKAGNPEYLGFARPLVTPAIQLEKMINYPWLRWMNMYLIGCYRKT